MEVESPPGEGTRILVEVPCENAVAAAEGPEAIAAAVNPGGASASKELA